MAQMQPHTIVSFDSAYDAFAFKSAALKEGIEGRLRTVPRQISAGCGTAWDSPYGWHDQIEQLISSQNLDVEGVHTL